MGINGLVALLKTRVPHALKDISTSELAGKRIGIDLAVLLCRGLATTSDSDPTWYLKLIVRQVYWMRSVNCKPIYVFDGAHPPEKNEERDKRRETKRRRIENAQNEMNEFPEDTALVERCARTIAQVSWTVLPEHIDAVRRVLVGMGVCTLNAPGEAEKCLAHMQRSDIIDHIFTEDSDTLACGAHSYIKNSGKLPTDHTGTLVELRPVLDTLNLTYDEFLTFCVLCGCDFAPKIAKVGPVKALKLVGEHKENIETCIQAAAPSTTSDVIARFQAARLLLSYDPNFEIPAIISDHDPLQLDALCEELGDRSFTAMFTRHISNSFVTAPCRREFATETTVETVLVTPQ